MIRLYHTSDLHDHRHIAAPLRRLRGRRPGLLADSGDALRGSQTIYLPREPIRAAFDAAGYDVQALGNREFHYLFGALQARLGNVRRPVVCANLVDIKGRPLPFRTDVTLRAAEGEDVRFFGLLVPQYPDGSPWEHLLGWRFRDPATVAAEMAATTPAGVTLVALSHLGLAADREVAARVPRLDLILGGHSHDTLSVPELVGGVPIVHAGPFGAYASRTELVVDGDRSRIVDFALEPLR